MAPVMLTAICEDTRGMRNVDELRNWRVISKADNSLHETHLESTARDIGELWS